MKNVDLDEWDPCFDRISLLDNDNDNEDDNDDNISSGILPPPPRDPLHRVNVIIGGTMSHGTLRVLPWRRFIKSGQNMFQEATWNTDKNDSIRTIQHLLSSV